MSLFNWDDASNIWYRLALSIKEFFLHFFGTFPLGLFLHLVWETAAPACHLESPTRFTRKRSPWCKRPSERPIRRIFWWQLLGWGWGHRNLQPLSGSHLNYSPIHSSPRWSAEPHWRRVSGHPDLRKSTTSRWASHQLKELMSAAASPKRCFNFIMCGQRAASHASLVGDEWRRRRGGIVTEWERGDEKQSCFGLSSEPLSKENLLGGLWTTAVSLSTRWRD